MVRKVAVVLLLGLAAKIANSKTNPEVKELQLAHDIFHFVISYMLDEDTAKTQQDFSLSLFILYKRDAYRSVISKLSLYPQPEEPVSVEEWRAMITHFMLGSVLVETADYGE
ncbi:MAG: hypothetical protein ACPL06_04145 [Candidatus Anstonellales archaeon]